jgi:hypothetical protein
MVRFCMSEVEEKKCRAIIQQSVPLNDLGQITETEWYAYLGIRLREAANVLLSELE